MSEVRHFPGSTQTIEVVLDGAATGGELALMTLRMPPGAGSPLHRHTLETEAPVELPSWVGSLRLSGVPCFDRRWTVRVDDGHISVEPE